MIKKTQINGKKWHKNVHGMEDNSVRCQFYTKQCTDSWNPYQNLNLGGASQGTPNCQNKLEKKIKL